MKRAQTRDFRQGRHRNVLCEMLLDVLRHSLLLPCGETASGILHRRSSAVVQAQELVGQYDAQSLGILSVRLIRIFSLGFELPQRFPHVLVEFHVVIW